MALDTYNDKRDFSQTSEPPGEYADPGIDQRRFVIQEHHASHLHFDLRLEIDGVLKSWAVPKVPTTDPAVKRLAMMTEDHPISYLTFSGTIPQGNYGAGTMSIWDSGNFDLLDASASNPDRAIGKGKLEIRLYGSKLTGNFHLVRTDPEHNAWLLIRAKDQNPPQAVRPPHPARLAPHALPGAVETPMMSPESVQPMLAVTRDHPFSDPQWQFEMKWDGYRALVFAYRGETKIFSRNHLSLDSSFPELAHLKKWLCCEEIVLDGEIVAFDSQGLPRFQPLQNRFGRFRSKKAELNPDITIAYMAFDVLFCDGFDLTSVPLTARRKLLAGLITPGGSVRFSDHVTGDGIALFHQVKTLGMEGIVAKRADSLYRQQRSSDWVKIKSLQSADVVIAGYTDSKSAGRPFGSLLISQYSRKELVSIGHVGTGFNQATMESLAKQMHPLLTEQMPFETRPVVNDKPHWLKPELVCEVKYSEITSDGQLRHPVFLQLRLDKPAKECLLGAQEPLELEQKAPQQDKPPRSSVLDKLLAPDSTSEGAKVIVDHHRVALSNLKKVFWPKTGATKRDLLRYYATVAHVLLPHLTDRPLVMQRYPNGVDGKSFFQHNSEAAPDFIRKFVIEERHGLVYYALCNDLPALLYLANSAAIPLHVWNVTTHAPELPDRIVFDLDPEGDFNNVIYVAQAVRGALDEIGLTSYPKTSGSSGLHVYVPIQPIYSSEDVVNFARLIGQIVQHRLPDQVTLERRINKRGAQMVYLDCLQNGVGKTVVAPYSVRAKETPTVSTPLTWDEVVIGLNPDLFTIDTVPERLLYFGDLFAPVHDRLQNLGPALELMATTIDIPKRKPARRSEPASETPVRGKATTR